MGTGKNLRVQYDFIASTGRTATTFIASRLDRIDGVAACHEGYRGSDKTAEPLLPLINLENAYVFGKPEAAGEVVAAKRGAEALSRAANASGCGHLIDVAYYNPTLAQALLGADAKTRMVGLIRNCADFVQSSTTLEGEDPLPVGWPHPEKPLSEREKFIAMGRIRPNRRSPIGKVWKDWSAVRRNIWLWEETNLLLTQARDAFPDRVSLVRFETLAAAPDMFWKHLSGFFDLPATPDLAGQESAEYVNRKPGGYQIGLPDSWTEAERDAAIQSQDLIERRATYDC